MRADKLGARHGLELASALVEDELGVAQRLEPSAEAGARLADPLRDGADPSAGERVEVEDAVGFAEPDRAEDDRLGLVASPGHADQSRSVIGESIRRFMRLNS